MNVTYENMSRNIVKNTVMEIWAGNKVIVHTAGSDYRWITLNLGLHFRSSEEFLYSCQRMVMIRLISCDWIEWLWLDLCDF